MKSKYELQLSPNGNGALFDAIKTNYIVENILRQAQYV